MVRVRRGDIVLVDLDPTKGSEQRGTRPCVVLQNDAGNRAASTTIVAPLTTSYDPQNIAPYEAEIKASNTVVRDNSVVLLNQIRVVSIPDRVYRNFGSLPPGGDELQGIEQAIKASLDMS